MLTNGSRPQLGMAFAVAALKPALPWIIGILGTGLSMIGVSYLARNEAEKWKEATGLNLQNIPQAVLAGGAGAIALAVAGSLHGVAKTIATSLGIAGLAGSLYIMFSGVPKTPATPAPTPAGSMPALAPATAAFPAPVWQGDILRAISITMPPTQPNTGGTQRSVFTDQTYEALVRNESDQTIDFFVGANIYDEDDGVIFASDKLTPPYNRVHVTLGPKGSPTESASLKLLTPAQSLGAGNVGVSAELFRNRDDSAPFLVSNSIPILYSWIG
jgi:hypothetical protein